MLLPIVLLLASAGPAQQHINAAPTPQQFSLTEQNHTRQFFITARARHALIEPRTYRIFGKPAANRFVNPGQDQPRIPFDEGIIVPRNSCLADGTCKAACASITAFVFSDGENPKLQYVTHCPNLDVPYQTKRAKGDEPEREHQPSVKHTAN